MKIKTTLVDGSSVSNKTKAQLLMFSWTISSSHSLIKCSCVQSSSTFTTFQTAQFRQMSATVTVASFFFFFRQIISLRNGHFYRNYKTTGPASGNASKLGPSYRVLRGKVRRIEKMKIIMYYELNLDSQATATKFCHRPLPVWDFAANE